MVLWCHQLLCQNIARHLKYLPCIIMIQQLPKYSRCKTYFGKLSSWHSNPAFCHLNSTILSMLSQLSSLSSRLSLQNTNDTTITVTSSSINITKASGRSLTRSMISIYKVRYMFIFLSLGIYYSPGKHESVSRKLDGSSIDIHKQEHAHWIRILKSLEIWASWF